MTHQHFQSVRRDGFGVGRLVSLLGGLGMVALAARRGRSGPGLRLMVAFAGAALALRGIARQSASRVVPNRAPPTFPYRETRRPGGTPADLDDMVDVASQESFPASDPPGYTQIRASADGALGRRS